MPFSKSDSILATPNSVDTVGGAPAQPEPVAPPVTPPPPVGEPEPDRLPDEAPLPNPDENDSPAKTMKGRP